jgi:putative flippase GtrA
MTLVQDFNNLFSPMDKKYCELFHAISVFYFLIMIMSVVSLVFLFKDIKRNKYVIANSIIVVLMLGVNYIYNRLLFNMCK